MARVVDNDPAVRFDPVLQLPLDGRLDIAPGRFFIGQKLNVTLGKAEFSNSQNANIQKWSAYVSGSANRQDFLECALDWVSENNIGDYMSKHRKDKNIDELKKYKLSLKNAKVVLSELCSAEKNIWAEFFSYKVRLRLWKLVQSISMTGKAVFKPTN